jgi:RNA polymerase sigma-70 factor (ECF subfamily)
MTGTANATAQVADAVLVEASRRGDLFAWEHLVRRYQEPVYRVAFLVVRDTRLAENATQSAFVRAYRALPGYQAEIGLLPWLIRIAAAEARQQRRESGRPQRHSRVIERSGGPRFPASALAGLSGAQGMTSHEREAVGEAFDRLGEEDRLILALRYLLGLTRDEAADALAIGSGLAEEHLQSAVTRLRTRMAAA